MDLGSDNFFKNTKIIKNEQFISHRQLYNCIFKKRQKRRHKNILPNILNFTC